MDPISVVGLAFSLPQVISQLKEILKAIKDAPKGFAIVIFKADRFA